MRNHKKIFRIVVGFLVMAGMMLVGIHVMAWMDMRMQTNFPPEMEFMLTVEDCAAGTSMELEDQETIRGVLNQAAVLKFEGVKLGGGTVEPVDGSYRLSISTAESSGSMVVLVSPEGGPDMLLGSAFQTKLGNSDGLYEAAHALFADK